MALPDSITYPKPPGQERPYPKPNTTGKALFKIPNHDLEGETAYEVYGDLKSDKVPLITLHGGPGFPHGYLAPLALLLTDFDIPVVMYDQIGCGESTHFPDHLGDSTLWNPDIFMAELDNLIKTLGIKTFDLFGHSFGGMLVAQYGATRQPTGLRKLIITNCTPSIRAWEKSANELRAALPTDIQETLSRCEKEGKTDSPEYNAAVDEFNKRHICRLDPMPKEFADSIDTWMEDPTVSLTVFGPSDFNVTGSSKDWSVEGNLQNLTVSAVPGGILIISGYFDVAQDKYMMPFLKEPSAKVKWAQFGVSSHSPLLEETEKFLRVLGSFLED